MKVPAPPIRPPQNPENPSLTPPALSPTRFVVQRDHSLPADNERGSPHPHPECRVESAGIEASEWFPQSRSSGAAPAPSPNEASCSAVATAAY